MSTHTATPWRIESGLVVNADGTEIAYTHGAGTEALRPTEMGANAQYIVQCVNSHAGLLAACKAVEKLGLIGNDSSAPMILKQVIIVRKQVSAAIAKAKEGV